MVTAIQRRREVVLAEMADDVLAERDGVEARRAEAEAVAKRDADRRDRLESELAEHLEARRRALAAAEENCRDLVRAVTGALASGNRAAAALASLGRPVPAGLAGPGGERRIAENISAVFRPLSPGGRFGGMNGVTWSRTWKKTGDTWREQYKKALIR